MISTCVLLKHGSSKFGNVSE